MEIVIEKLKANYVNGPCGILAGLGVDAEGRTNGVQAEIVAEGVLFRLPDGLVDEAALVAAVAAFDPLACEKKRSALAELAELDPLLPRAVEDLIMSLGIDPATLPDEMRGRLARKSALRAIVVPQAAVFGADLDAEPS